MFFVIFMALMDFHSSEISPCTSGLKGLYEPFVQVQSNSQITDIPPTDTQRLKDEHLSMSLRFFNLSVGIGPNDRGLPF